MLTVLGIAFILHTVSTQGNNVLLSPQSVEEWEDTIVTLTCSYEGQYNVLSVVWTLTNQSKEYNAVMICENNVCITTGWLNNTDQYSCICTNGKVFNLIIKRITRKRHGENWTCLYDLGVQQPRSNTATISVKIPVQDTIISPNYNNTYTTTENSTNPWKCATSHVRPKPKFRWYIDNETITDGDEIELSSSFLTDMDSDVIANYSITKNFKLNRTWNARYLYCGASNRVNEFKFSAQIVLNITYPPDGPPKIGKHHNGSEIKVIKGMLVTLDCTVTTGNPPPRLKWNRYDDQLQTSSGSFITKQISWVPSGFLEEALTCHSIHQDKIDTTYVTLNVLYPPENVVIYLQNKLGTFIRVRNSISVIERQPFLLNCSANSNPTVSIYEWSGLIAGNSSDLRVHDGVKRNQMGKLICRVYNIMQLMDPLLTINGNSSSNLDIDVLYPPTINRLKNLTLVEGEDLVYSCNATPGNPNISTFTWQRGTIQWDTQHLDFKNVSRNQSGTYFCIVSNFMLPSDDHAFNGTDIGQLNLTVQYKANVRMFVKVGDETKLSVTVNENETVTLGCEIEGNPLPVGELFVQHSYNLLQSQLKVTNISSESTEVLHIKTTFIAQYLHAGTLTCAGNNTMYNGEEYMSTKSMTLMVNYKPRKSPFHEIRDSVVSATSVPATINFATLAYPIPSTSGYIWSRNTNSTMLIWIKIDNYDISYTITTSGLQSNLTIKNVSASDFGLYRVTVENDFGSYNHTFRLIAEGKPEAPTQLECIDDLSNETSATLQWVPAFDGGFDQTFFLKLKQIDGDAWQEEHVTDQRLPKMIYTFHGLVSGTTYVVEINASNKLGNSSSLKITFATRTQQSSEKGQQSPSSNETPVGASVGGAIAALVVLAILIVSGISYKMRSQSKKHSIPSRMCHFNTHLRNMFNEDAEKTQANGVQHMFTATKVHVYPSASQEILLETSIKSGTTYSQHCDNDVKQEFTEYGNSQALDKKIERIYVSELFAYLADKTPENFEAEYMKLPRGFTMPYGISQTPGNIGLNRYNDICPYDHSRVIIEGNPDFYINASYIDGYKKKKTYIASLGPMSKTTNNFVMFWQMVWNEQSDIIVMLTRLNEPSGVKCEQYWPQEGKSATYGDITLTTNVEHNYSEYILRKFTISKGHEARNINQFHFMAWPDKCVPENVTCLLEFRRQLKKYHSVGPMIVHCSAGIGRTGTLIAIDILIEEGKHIGSVNVLQCVKTLRDQRVNMVQTLEQYYYIYAALVNSLVLEAESIEKMKFHEYAEQNKINVKEMFRKLNLSVEKDSIEESNARILNMKHRDKNRVGADIPGEANAVRLCRKNDIDLPDYINAVYINSFTKNNHFIVAQSPLTTGVEDFLCLIYQTDCTFIVSMDGVNERKTAAGYFPANKSTLTVGRFNLKCSMLETNESYEVRILKIKLTGQKNCAEKTVYHFQYKGWIDKCKVPSDAHAFVEFMTEVEDFARQLGMAESNVLVHCLTAYERSCLFCAVVVLTEKIQHEGEVCIGNTLRHIRTRRKLAFPNMEQLKFCIEAVNAYINIATSGNNISENVYVNVSVK